MMALLRPAAYAPPLPQAEVDPAYRGLRIQVFAGIFIGYAGYYLVRNNLALAIPDILREHPEYTKAQLGSALTGLAIAYGLSKFLMGSVSDRSNPKYFLPLGLLLSSAIMAAFGLVHAAYSSMLVIFAVMVLNGWVQGMGWPPCGKTMVHWFSTRERGRTVSLWNTAHNVGGALVAYFAVVGVTLLHDWHAKFYFNALIAAAVAIAAYFLLQDTPQSRGLPPIEQHNNDYPPGYSQASEQTLGFREIFFKYVLPNKYLWALAMANVFCYFVRYGVENWIPTYLETAKGLSFAQSSRAWSLYEWAAIPGTIACGWMSDKWFRGTAGAGDDSLHGAHPGGGVGVLVQCARPGLDRLRGADCDRFPHLRADHDHRPALARPRAEEGRGHGRRLHRVLRLCALVRRLRRGHWLDRRPLGLGRGVWQHGRVLRAHDLLQRAYPRAQGREPHPHAAVGAGAPSRRSRGCRGPAGAGVPARRAHRPGRVSPGRPQPGYRRGLGLGWS